MKKVCILVVLITYVYHIARFKKRKKKKKICNKLYGKTPSDVACSLPSLLLRLLCFTLFHTI